MPVVLNSPRIQFQILTDLFTNMQIITANQVQLHKQIEALPPTLKSKTIEDSLKLISNQLGTLNKHLQTITPMCQPSTLPADFVEKFNLLMRMAYVSSEHTFTNR